MLALTRGNRPALARLVGAYLALYVVLAEIDLDLPTPFKDGTAAAWAVDSLESTLVAALVVLADATAVALYLALRRIENASSASGTAAAFE